MAEPASLLAAFRRHAAARPFEPFLFYPHPRGWQWLSWEDCRRRVALAATALSKASEPIAFDAGPSVESFLLDLAARAAGCEATPVDLNRLGESDEAEAIQVWAGPGANDRLPESCQVLAVPGLDPEEALEEGAVHDSAQEVPAPAPLASEEQLYRDGVATSEAISGSAEVRLEREIAVLAHPLTREVGRRAWAWALVAGAAVLVEPSPTAHLATAAWARPTCVWIADREEERELRERVASAKLGKRSPFGRLRAVVVVGEQLGEEDEAFWRGRGVALLHFPA